MRASIVLLLALIACTRNPSEGAGGEPLLPTEPPAAAEPAPAPAPERGTPPSGAPAASFDPAAPRVAGLTFTVPPPFSYRQPTQSMRLAEYVVPERAGERPATMTIHHFAGMGGAIRDNVDRWVAQFAGPDGTPVRDARITTRTVAGMEVTMVDATGTYRGMNFGGAPVAPEPNQRMLGAIVMAPAGPVFFKLVGPAVVVERAAAAFTALVDSFDVAR